MTSKRKKEAKKKGAVMFGKEGETIIGEGKMNSIIGQGCKINGTIDVREGTLRIDGEFEGNINCPDTLIVGKGGRLKADIKVKNAVIGGTIVGNIDAREKVELQSGSRVEGDIKTSRLVIDEGVFFEGACKMSPNGKSISMPSPGMQSQERKDVIHSGTK